MMVFKKRLDFVHWSLNFQFIYFLPIFPFSPSILSRIHADGHDSLTKSKNTSLSGKAVSSSIGVYLSSVGRGVLVPVSRTYEVSNSVISIGSSFPLALFGPRSITPCKLLLSSYKKGSCHSSDAKHSFTLGPKDEFCV